MTTSTTEKPAEAPAKPKRAGRPAADPKADAVDLTGLTFEIAPKPKRKGAGDNPFMIVLGESYETETARATKVPAVALRRVEGLLRRAAGDLEIGVTIAATDPDSDGNVVITFMGKDRRKVKKKGEAATEDATEPAGSAASEDPGSAPASNDPATAPATVESESVPA